MNKSGWFRLWVVLTCAALLGVGVFSANYIWGKDACYTFVTVSIADNAQRQDRQLAEAMKTEATEKTFCGRVQYSPVLTLEDLAKRSVVTQVGVQWLEPSGWSFKEHDTLDVLNEGEIKATEIIARVSGYVHKARAAHVAWFVVTTFLACLAALVFGFASAWVRRGFQTAGA